MTREVGHGRSQTANTVRELARTGAPHTLPSCAGISR